MIEYRCELRPDSSNFADYEDCLEDLGLNGWDLVFETIGSNGQPIWIFKRNRSFVVGWNRKLMRQFSQEPVS